MSADSAPIQIRSIARAAAILRLLTASARGLGIAEIATELSLPRGTVHGIVRTLKRERFVEQDTDSGKYRLGETLLPMGFSYLEANALRAASLHEAHLLSGRTGESIRVGTLFEDKVLIVHHVFRPDNTHQMLDVGTLVPVHATALGKALLALRRDRVAAVAAVGLRGFTPDTRTDADALERELDEIAARGWATEIGELQHGAASIAAPIPAGTIAKPGAIAIEGPVDRLFEEGSPRTELMSAVTQSARAIIRRLGVSPWSR
jgi:DNA-binding IclR family transcriptional regulator